MRRPRRVLAVIATVVAGLVPAATASGATVAAGHQHTCAVQLSGGVSCWGENEDGQLGSGIPGDASSPVAVAGITDAIAVGAGRAHSCALRAGGEVSCWGFGLMGELGNGGTAGSTTPVPVSGLTDATAIGIGGNTSCAVKADATVVCWGQDTGTDTSRGYGSPHAVTPSLLPGVSGATGVLVSGGATCVSTVGGVRCWTYDIDNGDGSKGKSATALPIPVTEDVVSFSGSAWGHDCVAHAAGKASCRGYNNQGDLGLGVIDTVRRPDFADVVDVTDTTSVVATAFGGCTLGVTRAVRCWGGSLHGELGNGTLTASPSPVAVTGGEGAAQLTAAGGFHACLADEAGSVKCWGGNYAGQLGNGTDADSAVPVTVPGVTVPTAIATNYPEEELPGGGSTSDLGTELALSIGRVALRAERSKVKARLGGGYAAFSRFAITPTGKACPGRAKLAITSRSGKVAKGTFKVTSAGKRSCRLSAVVPLGGALAKAGRGTVEISGRGVKATTRAVTRG